MEPNRASPSHPEAAADQLARMWWREDGDRANRSGCGDDTGRRTYLYRARSEALRDHHADARSVPARVSAASQLEGTRLCVESDWSHDRDSSEPTRSESRATPRGGMMDYDEAKQEVNDAIDTMVEAGPGDDDAEQAAVIVLSKIAGETLIDIAESLKEIADKAVRG